MSLLEGKGWIVQDYYNEYLELKEEISNIKRYMEYRDDVTLEAKIIEKIARFKFVVKELQNAGVKAEDLMLLSMGVDVDERY